MPSSDHRLIHTPSSGNVEVRAALSEAHAHDSRTIEATRLKRRHFYHRVTLADLNTVLTALLGLGDVENPSGTLWRLTTQGIAKARQQPSPRHIPGIY